MTDTPEMRRQAILDWLHEQKSISIEELVNRLGVSAMTVHRDLDHLAKEGLVQKSYGHATLVEIKPESALSPLNCALCRADVPHRSAFTIQLQNGQILNACCPHCGLLLLSKQSRVVSALTRDFIYGRMVNVMQAIYVLDSRVQLCCVPSVLCFANREDGEAFQRGFGGNVLTYEEAAHYLSSQHCHPMQA